MDSTASPQPPTVAPPAGAWIETRNHRLCLGMALVAPPAGAWIETLPKDVNFTLQASRPLRARGLKLYG